MPKFIKVSNEERLIKARIDARFKWIRKQLDEKRTR